MNKNIGMALIALTILGIGYLVISSNEKVAPTVIEMEIPDELLVNEISNENTQLSTEMMVEDNQDEEIVPLASQGSYEEYSSEKIAMAATGDVVIFFHASWCPSCRALNSNIEENITSIPERLTILKADYDNETELKKKYGVTTQHTLVQVDATGTLIKKWSGGSKLENIVLQLQ